MMMIKINIFHSSLKKGGVVCSIHVKIKVKICTTEFFFCRTTPLLPQVYGIRPGEREMLNWFYEILMKELFYYYYIVDYLHFSLLNQVEYFFAFGLRE